MEFHLNPLNRLIEALNRQNDILGKARNAYLTSEATRGHVESVMIQQASGSSVAEKTVNAKATEEWKKFHVEQARLEAILEFQKLKYQILDKEFMAQYLSMKLDGETIKRG